MFVDEMDVTSRNGCPYVGAGADGFDAGIFDLFCHGRGLNDLLIPTVRKIQLAAVIQIIKTVDDKFGSELRFIALSHLVAAPYCACHQVISHVIISLSRAWKYSATMLLSLIFLMIVLRTKDGEPITVYSDP